MLSGKGNKPERVRGINQVKLNQDKIQGTGENTQGQGHANNDVDVGLLHCSTNYWSIERELICALSSANKNKTEEQT
jgi:hypothetical protein